MQWTKLIEIVIVRCFLCSLAFVPDKPYTMLLWIVRIITITTTAAATRLHSTLLSYVNWNFRATAASTAAAAKKNWSESESCIHRFVLLFVIPFSRDGISYYAFFSQNVSMLFILRNDRSEASILIGFFSHLTSWNIQPPYIVWFWSVLRFKLNHLHPLYCNFFFPRPVRMFIKKSLHEKTMKLHEREKENPHQIFDANRRWKLLVFLL